MILQIILLNLYSKHMKYTDIVINGDEEAVIAKGYLSRIIFQTHDGIFKFEEEEAT